MLDFSILDRVARTRPLIHCISNIVSANDCANLVLAVGASPIMAQAPEEMAAITAASAATVLNTGTPDQARFDACLLCAKACAAAKQPTVLDPVGVGGNPWRLERVEEIIRLFPPAILRVNLGEAQALLHQASREVGVDSPLPAAPADRLAAAVNLARQRQCVVLLSGPQDLITDGVTAWQVGGGSDLMSRLTGTGCMLSVLCGAFAAAAPDPLTAALTASAFWKACSRQAETSAAGRGPGSFHTALLDAAGTLTPERCASLAQAEQVDLP